MGRKRATGMGKWWGVVGSRVFDARIRRHADGMLRARGVRSMGVLGGREVDADAVVHADIVVRGLGVARTGVSGGWGVVRRVYSRGRNLPTYTDLVARGEGVLRTR